MKSTIKMAREAGFDIDTHESEVAINIFFTEELKAFEALVRADAIAEERAALMQLFTDPENQPTQHGTVTVEYMQREVAAEREACAKVCEELLMWNEDDPGSSAAKAIRERSANAGARGETK